MGFSGEKKLELETREGDLHGGSTEKFGFWPRVCCLKMIRWEVFLSPEGGGGLTILGGS